MGHADIYKSINKKKTEGQTDRQRDRDRRTNRLTERESERERERERDRQTIDRARQTDGSVGTGRRTDSLNVLSFYLFLERR